MNQPTRPVIETYHQLIKAKTNKVLNILGLVMAIFLVAALVMILIRDSLGDAFWVLLIIIVGVFLILNVAFLIIKRVFVSEKPLYQFLIPKLLEELLYNEDAIITYEPYPKPGKAIAESKLFWKHASHLSRAGYAFDSKQSFPIKVYDTYCYTQTSESTVLHFNGYFIAIEGISTTPIQIRTKGKPSRSKVHTVKTINEKRLKVYCQNEHAPSNHQVMALYQVFEKAYDPRNLFVSTLDSVIYIVLDFKKPLRKIRVLDRQSYQVLRDQIMHLIKTIDIAIDQVTE
jgi:hypothetical protein